MSRHAVIRHVFVDVMPDQLDEGVLYICLPFSTVMHLCCCGCGNEVVTPLSPLDWTVTFNGKDISLSPSIGNWSFACQSHYWITHNQVRWARRYSAREIADTRATDALARRPSPDDTQRDTLHGTAAITAPSHAVSAHASLWRHVVRWLGRSKKR